MSLPKGIKQIRLTYGNIVVTDNKITGPKWWTQDHITLVMTPEFRLCGPAKIWCHKLVAPDLREIFVEIEALEHTLDKPLIYSLDGCWVIRKKRNGSKISTHSWGIAIDLNAARNPMGAESNQSQALVKCFTDKGWQWGGTWSNIDAQHFQACSGY